MVWFIQSFWHYAVAGFMGYTDTEWRAVRKRHTPLPGTIVFCNITPP